MNPSYLVARVNTGISNWPNFSVINLNVKVIIIIINMLLVLSLQFAYSFVDFKSNFGF